MSSLEPYPSYKDSGVDWLGAIPADWNVWPLMGCASESHRKNNEGKEQNLLSLSYGKIKRKDITSNDGLLPASFDTYQIVERDDIIFRLTDLQNDKRSLRTARVTERGIVTSAYLAVTPRSIDPGFLAYAMRSTDACKVFYSMGGGLRQSMNFSDVKRLPVAVPPRSIQATVVRYLDRETAEIDAFIADQEDLIGLLTERRAATISHGVTKGLDPSAPMKDSGVEWLGHVPADWQILDPRRLFRQRKQLATVTDQQLAATQEFGVIPQTLYTEKTGYRVTAVIKGFEILKHVEPGDFVISMRSFQGGLEYSEYAGKISSAYVMVTPQASLADRYFRYLFKSNSYISALRATSNLVRDGQAMRFSNFGQVRIPSPPLGIQSQIAEYLDRETCEFDAAIADARGAIALSRERRAALISAAVTGKIDVRGAA